MKPSSLEDAVTLIRANFPESELQAWAAQSEDVARVQAHFALGLWVRNTWVYGDGSPLATKIMEADWSIQADDVSSIIISALWRVLNGFPCPSIEELLRPSPQRAK
jgi:hypothetical protein